MVLIILMNSCNYASINNAVNDTPIDTLAMVEKINSYEIQPIDRIVVFQVMDGKKYNQEYKRYYHSCLGKAYKYNKNHKNKFDEYDKVNSSSLFVTFDDSFLLYNDLEIKANDFIMVGTHSYDTKGGSFLGIEVPSERITVPVYVRKSELLGLYNK